MQRRVSGILIQLLGKSYIGGVDFGSFLEEEFSTFKEIVLNTGIKKCISELVSRFQTNTDESLETAFQLKRLQF